MGEQVGSIEIIIRDEDGVEVKRLKPPSVTIMLEERDTDGVHEERTAMFTAWKGVDRG